MELNDASREDDRQWLQLMMAGEERGFVTLYRKYQGPVYHFALHVSGVHHIAEEVTQETFLALMRAPQNYRCDRGPLLLYLFGMARRLIWKHVRRERIYEALDSERNVPAASPDFADDFVRQHEARRLRHAILSLPRKYGEVIVLCSLQELSYEDAAVVVGCSIGTVRSRMHRAKQLLLRKLTEGKSVGAARTSDSFLRYGRVLDYDL